MAGGTRETKSYWKSWNKFFVSKTTPDDPRGITRQNANLVPVIELRRDYMEGMIAKIEMTEREYQGKTYNTINIEFTDGEVLQLNRKGYAGGDFLYYMENIDLSKPVYIVLSYEEETKKQNLFIKQGGWLKKKYTKDYQGSKPAWEPYEVPGEGIKYSRIKEFEFFDAVMKEINEELNAMHSKPTMDEKIDAAMGMQTVQDRHDREEKAFAEEPIMQGGLPTEDDDLPF